MSKRWVTREEFADITAAATDPDRLIRKFLPQLRGHISTKYAWMGDRGNCVLDKEDLIQLASFTLMSLADRWATIVEESNFSSPDGTYDAMFFHYLKHETKNKLIKAYDRERRATFEGLTFEMDGEELERPSLYDSTDGEMHDRTGVRRRPDGPWWGAVVNELMTFWDQLAPKEKIVIALRYYDELPSDRVRELAGTSLDCLTRAVKRWRAHARNTVRLGDDWEPIAGTNVRTLRWEAPELLETYLRDRHGKTLHEYLGIVTISFRTDPDYLARVLDAAPFSTPGTRDQITAEQSEVIDSMAREGYNYSEISRAVGISSVAVGIRLDPDRRARLRHRNRSRAA